MSELPEPQSVKELQRFLGFISFYRRFSRGFSSVVALLPDLLKGKPKKVRYTESVRIAFKPIKKIFTSVPVLKLQGHQKNSIPAPICPGS